MKSEVRATLMQSNVKRKIHTDELRTSAFCRSWLKIWFSFLRLPWRCRQLISLYFWTQYIFSWLNFLQVVRIIELIYFIITVGDTYNLIDDMYVYVLLQDLKSSWLLLKRNFGFIDIKYYVTFRCRLCAI